jgi:hypothetical protein
MRLIAGGLESDGGVAQLGERLLCKQEVVGSIPITSTRSGRSRFASSRPRSVKTIGRPVGASPLASFFDRVNRECK